MAVQSILKVPNPILTTKCRPAKLDEVTKDLVKDLKDTLSSPGHPPGAGLAAPQIGVNKRIFVVRKYFLDPGEPEQEKFKTYVFVNPEITSYSSKTDIMHEGCLSIPDTYGKVQRSKKINVIAYDDHGNKFKMKASGFFARTIQHEFDHINGVLFTSKVIGNLVSEKEYDAQFEL